MQAMGVADDLAFDAVQPLRGLEIALLETRRPADLVGLLERRGGRVRCVPTVREVTLDGREQLASLLSGIDGGRITTLVALTGGAVERLLEVAVAAGCDTRLRAALATLTIVCRGPKPSSVLKREHLPIALQVAEPYTGVDVRAALSTLDLAGQGVAILHYGERDEGTIAAVRQQGGEPLDLCLYEWRLPDDLEPLRQLVRDLAVGGVDAVVFTSQVQARHLLWAAQGLGLAEAMLATLADRVVVAAVGPTCAAALRALGIEPDVVPTVPKMGQMVAALSDYVAARRGAS